MVIERVQTLYNAGELRTALNVLNSLEPQVQETDPVYLDLKLLKARLFLDLGHLDQGEELLNSLLDLARKTGSKLSRLDIIICLTDFLWRKGDWDKTFFMIEMGEYDFIKLGEESSSTDKAIRYSQLKKLKGIYYRFAGELDLALEYFNESLVEAEKTKDERLIAEIYNLIGIIQHENGDLTKSWNYYVKSYRLHQKLKDKPGMIVDLYNLGSIQEYIGELNAALENYQHALQLSEEIGNRQLKGKCLGSIGVVYQKQGNFDNSFEYLTKSLAIKSDIGNDVETSWTLYRITNLLLNSPKAYLAPIFMDGLEELFRKDSQNVLIRQHYKLLKATMLKNSDRIVDQAEAQQIFYDILDENIVDHELTIYAMIQLCALLLSELKESADPDILLEIEDYFLKLQRIVAEQHSYPLLIEIFILQAKFAILELDLNKALSYLNQANQMAEEKDLKSLNDRILIEQQKLLEKIEDTSTLDETPADKIVRVEESEMAEKVASLIKSKNKEISIVTAKPVLFLVVYSEGNRIYTKHFDESKRIDEKMIHSFVQTITSIINEAISFPGSIDRIQQGNYNLIFREIADVNVIYVYEGSFSYQSIKQFEEVINRIYKDPSIQTLLQEQSNTTEIINSLDQIIEDIFTKSNYPGLMKT